MANKAQDKKALFEIFSGALVTFYEQKGTVAEVQDEEVLALKAMAEAVVQRNPEHLQANLTLAQAFNSKFFKKPERALPYFKKVHSIDPHFDEIDLELGYCAYELAIDCDDMKGALADKSQDYYQLVHVSLSRAMEKFPNDSESLFMLGFTKMRLGQAEEGAQLIKRSIQDVDVSVYNKEIEFLITNMQLTAPKVENKLSIGHE